MKRIILTTLAALALASAAGAGPAPQKSVENGIALELSVQPVSGSGPLREAQDVRVTLKVTDQLTGAPMSGLYPGGWMDRSAVRRKLGEEAPADCKKKVESFLGGSMLSRPEVDLNVYYVLALNEDASISVVDPLFGYGNSRLLSMVFLASPGEDWVLSTDGRRLFVSMPEAGRIAVVDTSTWKVTGEVETGAHPRRLGLQPDGQYLWAATDIGVVAVAARDPRPQKAASIPTGAGGHDLAFSDDSRFAFVTNEADGTVAVIDVAKLAVARQLPVGAKPVSIAWSSQAQAAYVSSAGDGSITAVDGTSPKPRARIVATPGLGQIRFAPGGRLAFVVHPGANAVHIVDAASNRLIQTADVDPDPDQVAFSDELAYVRHRGSDAILMIPLKTVGEPGRPVSVVDFPGGQHPAGRTAHPTPAAGIVQAPGAAAVLVANPEDQVIYFYKEGMAAPMGHFKNYGKQPRATLVVDRSLRETAPGVYETMAKLGDPGDYDVAFFVDSPKLVRCFPVKVAEDPALAAARRPKLGVEPLGAPSTVTVGEDVALRFRLTDPVSGAPRTGLRDVRVLTFLSPGVWQRRQWAAEAAPGTYEIHFQPAEPGVYFVFLEVASAGLPYQKSPFLVLSAEAPKSQGSNGDPQP
jgi:YVTN family beta-propeller protein